MWHWSDRRWLQWKTDPNNTRHVIWAISKLIYFLSCLIYTNNYIYVLFYIFKDFGKVAAQETRPNDARCIIWATNKFFFSFFCVKLILHQQNTSILFGTFVVYLIILGAIQADSRESPRTVQVNYTLLGCYLYKWEFLVQARSANFLLTFQSFSGLILGQYPKKETQVSSSNIEAKYSQQESNN